MVAFGVLLLALLQATVLLGQETTDGFDAINKPGNMEKVNAGSQYKIRWEPSEKKEWKGPITIGLLGGPSEEDQDFLFNISQGINQAAGFYIWNVQGDLGDDATYGLQITLDSNEEIFQYSYPFVIKKNSTAASEAATQTSGTASATGSLASATITSESSPTTDSSPGHTAVGTASDPTSIANASGETTSDSGLSGGAIAGIAIGAIAGAALLGALVWLVVYYRRKAQKGKVGGDENGEQTGEEAQQSLTEMNDMKKDAYEMPSPNHEQAPMEMDGLSPRSEMDSNWMPQELPSAAPSELPAGPPHDIWQHGR